MWSIMKRHQISGLQDSSAMNCKFLNVWALTRHACDLHLYTHTYLFPPVLHILKITKPIMMRMWRPEFHATNISHSSAQACEWNATEIGESKYPTRKSNLKYFVHKDSKPIFSNITPFPFPFNSLGVAGSRLLDLFISSQNELYKNWISSFILIAYL